MFHSGGADPTTARTEAWISRSGRHRDMESAGVSLVRWRSSAFGGENVPVPMPTRRRRREAPPRYRIAAGAILTSSGLGALFNLRSIRGGAGEVWAGSALRRCAMRLNTIKFLGPARPRPNLAVDGFAATVEHAALTPDHKSRQHSSLGWSGERLPLKMPWRNPRCCSTSQVPGDIPAAGLWQEESRDGPAPA